MDKMRACELLMLYRPGDEDPDDQDMAQALELARKDPELARWFADFNSWQNAIRSRFTAIEAPEGLKEQIISERPRPPLATLLGIPVTVRGLVGAAAFAVILIVAASFLWTPPVDKSFGAFRHRMAGIILRQYPDMDLETADLAKIRQYLADHQAYGDYTAPRGVQAATPTGCKVMQYHGQTVAMVCFRSAADLASPKPDLFLFVVNSNTVTKPPVAGSTTFTNISDLATASWTDGDKLYVLSALGGEERLRKMF